MITLRDETRDVICDVLDADLNTLWRFISIGALCNNYISIFWLSGLLQRSNFLCLDAVSSFVTVTY